MFRIFPFLLMFLSVTFSCRGTESADVVYLLNAQTALLKISEAEQQLHFKVIVNEQLLLEKTINNKEDDEYFEVLQFNQLQNNVKVVVNYDSFAPQITLTELNEAENQAYLIASETLTNLSVKPSISHNAILTNLTHKNLQSDFSQWSLRRLKQISKEHKHWSLSFLASIRLNQFSANDIVSQCHSLTSLFEPSKHFDSSVKVSYAAQLAATLYVFSKHHGKLNNERSSSLTQNQFLQQCGLIFTDLQSPQQTELDLDKYAKYLYQGVLESLSDSPQWLTADILHHLWFYYNFRERHGLALETAESAIAKAKQAPEFAFLMPELYSSAFLSSYRQGAFAQAHNYLNQGLNLDEQTESLKIASLLFSKGFLFYQTGEFDTGSRYFNKTISEMQTATPDQVWKLENCLDSNNGNLMIARAAVMIGATSREEEQLTEAELWLQCAAHLLRDKNDYYQIVLQVELAKTAIKQNQFDQAKVHLENVLNDPRTLYATQIDAKILEQKIKTLHLGEKYNKDELDKLASLLGYTSFFDENITLLENTALPIKQIEVFTLLVQVSHQQKAYKWVDIFADKAMSLIEKSRASVANPQAWNAARFSFINTYIVSLLDESRLLKSQGDYAKLFEVLEKYYSVDPRFEKNLFSINDTSSENAEQIKRLYDIWLAEEKIILMSESDNEKSRLYEARDDYLAQVLKQQNDSHVLPSISLFEFQKSLSAEQMLVRFFSDGEIMYSLNITQNLQEVRKIARVTELKEMVNNYVDGTTTSNKPWLTSQFRHIPLLPIEMIRRQGIDKILIIPDESLHKMPFSMWNTATDERRYKPLVESVQSIFITSASSYLEDIVRTENENFEVSIFANPDFTIQQSSETDGPNGSEFKTLFGVSSLPGTLEEAEFMADLFSEQQINRGISENATSQFLMSDKVRNSKILHIGTHGYFDQKLPDIVGVLTAGAKENGHITPGFLSLNQLLSKPVSSDLVFVSGCETMVGKNYKGSGMRSITRGFLAQGAKSVVGTIWPIQDRPTSVFVKKFYVNLLETDGDAPRALQITQRDFHRGGKYRHPKYWAGFVLTSTNQGDSQIFSREIANNR